MTEQETVDRLAALATPQLTSLLRLRNTKHVYDPTPGGLNSTSLMEGKELTLDKLKRASQPYRNIERFLLGEEKIMQFVVAPGVMPIVLALSKEILGKDLLVTRKIAGKNDDKGVIGHLDGFGVRIMMHFDEDAGETVVEWSCLYGVK